MGIRKSAGIFGAYVSVIMMPIAYVLHWMEHSLKGVLSYFGIFLIIFIIIWIIQYAVAKHNVKKLNETLHKKSFKARNRVGFQESHPKFCFQAAGLSSEISALSAKVESVSSGTSVPSATVGSVSSSKLSSDSLIV